MTKSDLILEVNRVIDSGLNPEESKKLILCMYHKIIAIYEVIHALDDGNDLFLELGKILREKIES